MLSRCVLIFLFIQYVEFKNGFSMWIEMNIIRDKQHTKKKIKSSRSVWCRCQSQPYWKHMEIEFYIFFWLQFKLNKLCILWNSIIFPVHINNYMILLSRSAVVTIDICWMSVHAYVFFFYLKETYQNAFYTLPFNFQHIRYI